MSDSKGTLQFIAEETARILKMCAEFIGNPADSPLKTISFLRELGWNIPITDMQIANFEGSTLGILAAAGDIADELSKPSPDYSVLPQLIRNFMNQLKNITGEFNIELISEWDYGEFMDKFTAEFPKQLLDYTVSEYLDRCYPKLYNLLKLIGIAVCKYEEPQEAYRAGYIKREIRWKELPGLLNGPQTLMREAFGWGTSEFDADLILTSIHGFMSALGLPAYYFEMVELLPGTIESALGAREKSLCVPFYEHEDYLEAGVNIYSLPSDSVSDNAGIAISPYLIGNADEEIEITDLLKVRFKADAQVGLNNGYALTVRPKTGFDVTNVGSGGMEGNFRIEFIIGRQESTTLLGNPGATRLEAKGITFAMFGGRTSEKSDLGVEMKLNEVTLVIAAGEGDGLIQEILPKDPLELSFHVAAGVSKEKGFYFGGGAKLEYTFHINKQFGPVYIRTFEMCLQEENGNLCLTTAASVKAELGPIHANVKSFGLKTFLDMDKPGLLGNADLDIGFKLPSGAGLSLDTQGISGGGYLEADNGNYAGILYLDIKKKVAITVIGIITTRLPDGSRLFSLNMLGMAEFPPIQLGFGFVLTGLGFMAALNCDMDSEALQNAVRTNSLNSLLFPPDPIKNAPKIIADLKSFFPVKKGNYVFGAMAKLGWGGAMPIIQADVGIFLSIGDSIRIALAGIAHAELPSADNAVLALRFSILGILDFGNSTLSIDSSLEGSRLLSMTLSGDIALRACWGDNPRFALSAGGFYPGYKIPQGFPALKRLSLTIGADNPRIGLFFYLAVTENSVQFGANLLFYFKKKISLLFTSILLEIDGSFSFDALFKFNPFSFCVAMSAKLTLKKNGDCFLGIWFYLSLEGPNNYHAVGTAKCEVCGIDVEFHFDKTFGVKQPEPRKIPVSALGLLKAELDNPKNWTAVVPEYIANRVMFNKDIKCQSYMDTFGDICFRQKAVPLRFRIEKIGETPVNPDEAYLYVEADMEGAVAEPVRDSFAPGQFKYLTDAEKISRPAYENLESGIKLTSKGTSIPVIGGKPVACSQKIGYVTKRKHSDHETKVKGTKYGKLDLAQPIGVHEVMHWNHTAGRKFHNKLDMKPANVRDQRIKVAQRILD